MPAPSVSLPTLRKTIYSLMKLTHICLIYKVGLFINEPKSNFLNSYDVIHKNNGKNKNLSLLCAIYSSYNNTLREALFFNACFTDEKISLSTLFIFSLLCLPESLLNFIIQSWPGISVVWSAVPYTTRLQV